MRPGPVDVAGSGFEQGSPVPLLVIAGKIETQLEPVGAHVAPLVAGLDAGVALVQAVAIADHAEAEGVLMNVHGGVALSGPALLGVIEEAGQVQVETLFALGADLEVHDHVVRHVAFDDVHADIRHVEFLLDAASQAFEQRWVEILAGDLAQFGPQRVAQLGAALAGDLDAFDDQSRVHVGGPGFLVGRLVGEGDADSREHHREDSRQQQRAHT